MTTSNRFIPSWPLIVFVVVTISTLFSGQRSLADGDTYMHIGIGNWILAHGSVPSIDVFSYTMAGQPWAAHEWLAEVVLALAYRFGSWTGLVLMAGLSLALAMALMLKFMLKRMTPLYALGFLALSYLAMETHLVARPHVLTWPLIVLWMCGLLEAVENRRLPHWGLILVLALWANLHGGFILGFAVAAPMIYEAIFSAQPTEQLGLLLRWCRFLVIAALACCVHPAGWGAFTFLSHLMSNDYLNHISEWESTNLQEFYSLAIWIYVLLGLGLSGMLRLPIIRVFFILGLLCEAFAHVRYLAIFGTLVPLIVARPFGKSYKAWGQTGAKIAIPGTRNADSLDLLFEKMAHPAGLEVWVAAVVIIFSASLICIKKNLNEPVSSTVPIAAVDKALSMGLQGHVFNQDAEGGYLIQRGIPVYTDGRADLYGADFMRRQQELLAMSDLNAIQTRLDQADIEWVLIPISAHLTHELAQMPSWQKIYEDRFVCIFRRVIL